MSNSNLKFDRNDTIVVQNLALNKILINLPFEGYTIKVTTSLFDFTLLSPAKIKLISISDEKYKLKIKTDEFKLVTLLPSLVLEILNPDGVVIFKIVAPPE